MSRTSDTSIVSPHGLSSSQSGFALDLAQRPRSVSGSERSDIHSRSIDAVSLSGSVQDDATISSVGLGARILMSLARAKAVIIKDQPPHYTRGAWAIINDVPYPPPPPYAGSSRHPPTYEDAMEIGVVASPLRVEQMMHRRLTEPSLPRTESAPQLTSRPAGSNSVIYRGYSNIQQANAVSEYLLPETPVAVDGLLPKYGDIETTVPLSPVVRRWNLGQPALEKPPLHPKGHQYPPNAQRSSDN